jgi:hypothetical protein
MTEWKDIPKDVKDRIFRAAMALIYRDTDEAYHQLYAIADPEFTREKPWQEYDGKMRIYFDDVRDGPAGWVTVRTAGEVYDLIKHGIVAAVSLDHDVGKDPVTGEEYVNGYDLTKMVTEEFATGKLPVEHIPEFTVHSMNPVGRDNMNAQIRFLKRLMEERKNEKSKDKV